MGKIFTDVISKQIAINMYFLEYIFICSIIAFIIFGIDKVIAIINGKNKEQYKGVEKEQESNLNLTRFSTKSLLLISFLGGAIGGIIGMITFHHKTSNKIFTKTMPILSIIQFSLIMYTVFDLAVLIKKMNI